jgi:hypothetical protein
VKATAIHSSMTEFFSTTMNTLAFNSRLPRHAHQVSTIRVSGWGKKLN